MSKKLAGELFQKELGDDWKVELTEIIQKVVKKELDKHTHLCRLEITDKEAKELAYFFRMMRTLGKGEIDNGLKVMQDNHEWMASQRRLGSKVSSFVLFAIIASAVSSFCYYVWVGFKDSLGR